MKYAVALLFCLLPLWAQAAEPGSKLAPWTLLDQYDRPYTLDADTRILLVARDMDGAKLVKPPWLGCPRGIWRLGTQSSWLISSACQP